MSFPPIADIPVDWYYSLMFNLAEIVVVNESRDEATAGDVTVFRNADFACGWLEHWWVENCEGSAFTASGDRLALRVNDRDQVVVMGREAVLDGATIVRSWLQAAATSVLEARRVKAARGEVILSKTEKEDRLPISTEQLVTYVGFTT